MNPTDLVALHAHVLRSDPTPSEIEIDLLVEIDQELRLAIATTPAETDLQDADPDQEHHHAESDPQCEIIGEADLDPLCGRDLQSGLELLHVLEVHLGDTRLEETRIGE